MVIKEMLLGWGMLLLSVLFNASSVFVIKMRLDELGPVRVDSPGAFFGYFLLLVKSWLIVGAMVLFFLAPFLFAVALSRMEISVAYPVQVVLNLVLLVFLAVVFLGEHITSSKIIAMVLAIVCIYLLRK